MPARVRIPALSVLALAATAAIACQRNADVRVADASAGIGAAGGPSQPRSGPNVVGINCDTPDCQASCIAGSSILLAYGFHGRSYDTGGPVSDKCGEGVEWLGGCIGQESCSITTTCKTSAMYLICR